MGTVPVDRPTSMMLSTAGPSIGKSSLRTLTRRGPSIQVDACVSLESSSKEIALNCRKVASGGGHVVPLL